VRLVAVCIPLLSLCIVQVVRENNEAQGRALDDAAAETKRLKQRVKELADLLDAETDARNLASQELEVWPQTEHFWPLHGLGRRAQAGLSKMAIRVMSLAALI
jgi:CHASE1-domain containing sensor protein